VIKTILRKTSIKRKLILLMMLTSVIVLVMTALPLVVNDVTEFRSEEQQKMTALAEIISKNTAAAVMFSDRKAAEVTLAGLSINPHVISAYVVTSDGAVFAKYHNSRHSGMGKARDEKSIEKIIREARTGSSVSAQEGDDDLAVAAPIILDNQEVGLVVVQSDLDALHDRITRALITVAGIFIVAIVIAYLVSSKLQRVISEPILHLADTMKTVSSEKNYAVRARAESKDEIGQLFDGFNDMLTQIQKRDSDLGLYAAELRENNKELKAFLYSVAHDLRGPLVNMKGFAGELRSALQEINSIINEYLPALSENHRTRLLTACLKDVPEALGYIDSSGSRLDELINAVLKLSRLGRQELKSELIKVQAIVQSVLKNLHHVIETQGITVKVGPLPEIVADRNALLMIFGNILDNAVKYLRPGVPGEIEIIAETNSEETTFSIRDNGRGIPNDEISKVFEMFRRIGEQDKPGEGVGLACVKTLVRRHGGRIWCESTPGAGTTFHFTIPENAGLPDQALG
jgi:signal transduction histidine kinase